MIKFNLYNVPLDYKKADRTVNVQQLLNANIGTKLSLTSDDGVTYSITNGTSMTMSYKTESVNKKNYLEVDCSHLDPEDRLLGIAKSYWFITNTVSANSMSNFKSNWVLDVFATYGSQILTDLTNKPVKVIRQHVDRFKKQADNTLVAKFSESEMFTTEVEVSLDKCAKNITAFSNTKMVGDVKASEIVPTGLFLLQAQELAPSSWDPDTGIVSSFGKSLPDSQSRLIDFETWYQDKLVDIDIIANRDYSDVKWGDDESVRLEFANARYYESGTRYFRVYARKYTNPAVWNKITSNDGKTYKVRLKQFQRYNQSGNFRVVDCEFVSATEYIPAKPSKFLDLWNDYFVNSTGGVQYALILKKPYTDTMQGAINPDVQLSGVLAPISTKAAADATWIVDNQLSRFQTTETLSVRNSNFVYMTAQDNKITYGQNESKLVTCAKDGVAAFKSVPVKRKITFTPSYEFDRIILTSENKLVDYGFSGDATDWYYKYGGSDYVFDGEYWDSKTNELFVNSYFNHSLPSRNSLLSFNPKNEVKAMLSLLKMSLLYIPEGSENFISLEKLFRNTTTNHKYIWQQEYAGPAMSQIRSLILPTKNINIIANQFISNDNTLTPINQDAAKQYALENTNRIDAAKAGIEMNYKHQNANAIMGAASGLFSGIVGSTVKGGAAGLGAYMAVGGITQIAQGVAGMIQARESREQAFKQLQAEIDDAGAQPGSHNGGSNALLNNYSSISPECPWELATYLPSEKLINSTAMYLHKYGYSSNDTKFFGEDIWKTREDFNFIQITEIEALSYTGNYHKEVIDLIQFELANGVRLWHTTNIGDFTTGNVERSLV